MVAVHRCIIAMEQPVEQALLPYPSVTVSAAQAVRFRNGGALAAERLKEPLPTAGLVRVYAPEGAFLGLGSPNEIELTVDCLL